MSFDDAIESPVLMKETLKNTFKIHEHLLSSSSIVFTTHVIPDGDAIGSVMALYNVYSTLGKDVHVINHSPTPDSLKFLDPDNIIKVFSEDAAANTSILLNAGSICIVDTNELSRTRSMEEAIRGSKAEKICIDHHLGLRTEEYFLSLTDTEYPATAQILYNYFYDIDEKLITQNTASALYTGIMTDTGSFRYPRTTSRTFNIAADLVDRGADPVFIYDNIYSTNSISKLKLTARFIEKLRFFENGRVVSVILTLNDFKDFDADPNEVEGFSSIVMGIKNAALSILIFELENSIKVSFRSKGEIYVNLLAKEFGGGGHKNASGASLPKQEDLQSLQNDLLIKAIKYIDGSKIQ